MSTKNTVRLRDALGLLPAPPTPRHPRGAPFAQVLSHGSMALELYRPEGADLQTPHDRDELYVVVSGCGEFFHGGEVTAFGPGDCLFVPAGVDHRFTRFSDDFMTWVVFYGPPGGENPCQPAAAAAD